MRRSIDAPHTGQEFDADDPAGPIAEERAGIAVAWFREDCTMALFGISMVTTAGEGTLIPNAAQSS